MLTEKILFQNSSLAFYYHPRPAPPQFGKRPDFFRFFFRTLPLLEVKAMKSCCQKYSLYGGLLDILAIEAYQQIVVCLVAVINVFARLSA